MLHASYSVDHGAPPLQVYLLAEDDYAPTADFKTKLPTVLQHLPLQWQWQRWFSITRRR